MTEETAQRINSAACRVWFYKEGIRSVLSLEDIGILNSVSAAQIQTAVDVVEASNAHRPSVGGKRTIRCTLAPESVASIKEYVASLPHG